MALYLIQHGKSLPKDLDPDQGLSEEGIAETRRMANLAKDHGVAVSQIRHSVKTRARQTAEIFAQTLNPQKVYSGSQRHTTFGRCDRICIPNRSGSKHHAGGTPAVYGTDDFLPDHRLG